MSQGVLIAEEQTVLQTAETPLVGTLSDSKVKSKAAKLTYRIIKRSFDLLFGLIGALFILPLATFIKLAYILTGDFSSIFFVQKRIGLHGHEFNFYKFRTMVKDADLKLVELLENESYAAEWKKYRKLKNDPRISKVGKFLRKTSLDEFPQFLNVLKGDMSIIGNRPYLPNEKNDMGYFFDNITSTKGGLVSYWAVKGRNELDFDERLRLEQYYSLNQSFDLDVRIFLSAFKTVVATKGAN